VVTLRGGAGGAPCLGATVALFHPALLIILPLGLLGVLIIGYASVATLTIGILSLALFVIRYYQGASPWEYIVYGAGALILLVIALMPNIKRLMNGTERLVGIRAWLKKKQKPLQ